VSTVELQNVSRWYGNVVAVNDISMTLQPGVTGLLGPNGAGKTTVLHMMAGFLSPSKGTVTIDYVVPDYYARRPKACMGGWARQFINISPSGLALPCHAAESIAGLTFDSVRDRSLADIWRHSKAFELFRGIAWMPEPCASCERREIDWGGCRCQAFLLAGDAGRTDPVCTLSPDHGVVEAALQEAEGTAPEFVYRRYSAAR